MIEANPEAKNGKRKEVFKSNGPGNEGATKKKKARNKSKKMDKS